MDDFGNSFERAEYLQGMLITHATGGSSDNADYQLLRTKFLSDVTCKNLVPRFVRTNRNLDQFWQYIKAKFPSYAERRSFIWEEFGSLLEHLEVASNTPSDKPVADALVKLDESGIHSIWAKALERRTTDPEGAITSARTLLESVCKHILDDRGVVYDGNSIELHELYKLVATELTLSPDQHNEKVFKQILGGCSGIVSGLSTLRNRLGDAHGKGKLLAKPSSRHAELAVNVAGSIAMFLVGTHMAR